MHTYMRVSFSAIYEMEVFFVFFSTLLCIDKRCFIYIFITVKKKSQSAVKGLSDFNILFFIF